MGELKEPAAFIVGAPRSGTTLLAAILHRHPDVAVTPETHFFRALDTCGIGPGDLIGDVEEAVDRVFSAVPWPDALGVERSEISSAVEGAGERRVKALLKAIGTLYARKRGASLWVEKTPDHALHIPAIRATFPGAKIIHIVRDGRDVALSLAATGWYGYAENYLYGLNEWRRMVEAAASHRPDLTVRYEDLVGEPESVVRRVCDALGISFARRMLSPSDRDDDLIEYRHSAVHPDLRRGAGKPTFKDNIKRPISAASVGKWRQMHEWKQMIAEAYVGDLLDRFGYERRFRVAGKTGVALMTERALHIPGLADRLAREAAERGLAVEVREGELVDWVRRGLLDEDGVRWVVGLIEPDASARAVGSSLAGVARLHRLRRALGRVRVSGRVVILYKGNPRAGARWRAKQAIDRIVAGTASLIVHDSPEPDPQAFDALLGKAGKVIVSPRSDFAPVGERGG